MKFKNQELYDLEHLKQLTNRKHENFEKIGMHLHKKN